jgi:hypothetical protein
MIHLIVNSCTETTHARLASAVNRIADAHEAQIDR